MESQLDLAPQSRAELTADPAAAIGAMLADPQALRDLDVDKIREVQKLFQEVRAEQARIAYALAFNRVQARMEPVHKRGYNEHTHSAYALAEDVARMLDPLLVAEGFSWSVSTDRSDLPDHLRIILVLRHVGGHFERHHWDAPIDITGMKGAPTKTRLHGMGSTLSYCSRCLRCSVFGVQITRDDDGNTGAGVGPGAERITANEQVAIKAGMDEVKGDWDRLYTWLGIAALADLPRARYRDVMTMIAAKRETIRQAGDI